MQKCLDQIDHDALAIPTLFAQVLLSPDCFTTSANLSFISAAHQKQTTMVVITLKVLFCLIVDLPLFGTLLSESFCDVCFLPG